MTGIAAIIRNVSLPVVLALVMSACGGSPPDGSDGGRVGQAPPAAADVATGEDAAATVAEVEPEAPEAGAGDDDAGQGFDIASLQLSTAELGELPFFSIPEGYRENRQSISRLDFAQAAFWTGDRFEIVEGRVYATGIRVDRASGKQFSAIEVTRNLEHAVAAAGGIPVFSGTLPAEARKDAAVEALMRPYRTEARCHGHNPLQTYALRRADGDVWVRVCMSQNFVGLIVAQAQAFAPTSALLPASELRQQLDADGRVAIQVNFAVDEADILPESQPQIEQVLALLSQDGSLQLSIEGHTDNTGTAARNRTLSEARAQAVVAALTAEGIDAARLSAAGFGPDRPVADNDSEEGRAKNRRVELVRR